MVVISMLCNTYTEVLLLIHKNSHNMLTLSESASLWKYYVFYVKIRALTISWTGGIYYGRWYYYKWES